MFRVLPPTFGPVLQQIRLQGFFVGSNSTQLNSTRLAPILQNKLHFFVARFTVLLRKISL